MPPRSPADSIEEDPVGEDPVEDPNVKGEPVIDKAGAALKKDSDAVISDNYKKKKQFQTSVPIDDAHLRAPRRGSCPGKLCQHYFYGATDQLLKFLNDTADLQTQNLGCTALLAAVICKINLRKKRQWKYVPMQFDVIKTVQDYKTKVADSGFRFASPPNPYAWRARVEEKDRHLDLIVPMGFFALTDVMA